VWNRKKVQIIFSSFLQKAMKLKSHEIAERERLPLHQTYLFYVTVAFQMAFKQQKKTLLAI